MNLPVSLAIRGRHAADNRARVAWARVMAELREVDAVFSTYRLDSVVSRLGRGEIALEACPPEVAEVLALGELAGRQSEARSGPVGPGRPARPCSIPPGW
jgi:thiamine biosynthesis lipoprotein